MTAQIKIAVLIGSLRADGFSKRLASALVALAPPELSLSSVPIGDLPLFNQDEEHAPPEEHIAFRRAIQESAAVLLVTPEYNRSVPGALKNALDIASRPAGASALSAKPAAVVSQSPGTMGGMAANHSLRQALMAMNMPTMPQPEIYLAHSGDLLGENGAIRDPAVSALLAEFMQSFATWIGRFDDAVGDDR